MADFPTLSRYPKPFREGLESDPSLRSQPEDGKVISRARATSTKKMWEISYDNLIDNDKDLLVAFQDTVMVGADVFNWTNPQDEVVYVVRFASPIIFDIQPTDIEKWEARFTLIED